MLELYSSSIEKKLQPNIGGANKLVSNATIPVSRFHWLIGVDYNYSSLLQAVNLQTVYQVTYSLCIKLPVS